ncbi:unnamed protein product [Nesidiocoris tenuis]|uniref:Uncharacterized protein n=1 Tax=Nesidiocoris tenuis TaxID=355587 RepID=A0A6H5H4K0_9HEMI|nr:unnamed protein product [Nesidiocoris tenuis]
MFHRRILRDGGLTSLDDGGPGGAGGSLGGGPSGAPPGGTSVLDLRQSPLPSAPNGGSSHSNPGARPMPNQPFFPSLMLHSRPPRSRPMDSAGRVLACQACIQHLIHQWQASPNPEGGTYYPFITRLEKPSRAKPISPTNQVEVCSICFKSIPQKHQGYTGLPTTVHHPPPPPQPPPAPAVSAPVASSASSAHVNNKSPDIRFRPYEMSKPSTPKQTPPPPVTPTKEDVRDNGPLVVPPQPPMGAGPLGPAPGPLGGTPGPLGPPPAYTCPSCLQITSRSDTEWVPTAPEGEECTLLSGIIATPKCLEHGTASGGRLRSCLHVLLPQRTCAVAPRRRFEKQRFLVPKSSHPHAASAASRVASAASGSAPGAPSAAPGAAPTARAEFCGVFAEPRLQTIDSWNRLGEVDFSRTDRRRTRGCRRSACRI